jgi:hypothetical protein
VTDQRRHISRAELRKMNPAEVLAAHRAGELKHLADPESVTAAELAGWHEDDLVTARREGRLAHLGIDPEDS